MARRSRAAQKFSGSKQQMPLDVLIWLMRRYFHEAEAELAKAHPDHDRAADAFRRAAELARIAAPYVHPKRQFVEGPAPDYSRHTDAELETLERLLSKGFNGPVAGSD
jgi:hypothetical protein